MRLRAVKIKRVTAQNKYMIAEWFLRNFPDAIVYVPQDFGYVRFEQ